MARTALIVAAAGTTTPITAVQRTATTIRPRTRTTMSVFAQFILNRDEGLSKDILPEKQDKQIVPLSFTKDKENLKLLDE